MRRLSFVVLVMLAPAAHPAQAQGPPGGGVRWSLGVGVLSSPRPYVDADNSTRVIPLLELYSKRFFVQGIRLGVRAVQSGPLTLDVVAGPRFLGFEEGDSAFLRGMEERKESIDLGLSLGWNRPSWGAVAWARRDLSGHSDGVQAGADVFLVRTYLNNRLRVQPGLGIEWQDRSTVDYYYGVRPDEALPGRPAYQGRSTFSSSIDLLGFYRLTRHVTALAILRGTLLGDEIVSSPIVDRDNSYFGLVGLSYGF